jgi:hypothetical protein
MELETDQGFRNRPFVTKSDPCGGIPKNRCGTFELILHFNLHTVHTFGTVFCDNQTRSETCCSGWKK